MNNVKKIPIDVVIPVYNGAAFIRTALLSVVQQTFSPEKIIVINDGSTDETVSVVSNFATTSVVPVVLITKENGGLSSARNAGIKNSTAALVAFLDADDTWESTKLEKQVAIFESSLFPSLGLVYCDYDVIDPEGRPDLKSHKVKLDSSLRGNIFPKLLVANKILSSGSGVLIRRSIFETVGLFNEKLRFGEDWDMWLRIAEKYSVDYAKEILVHIRRHSQNMTVSKKAVFTGEIIFYTTWLPYLKSHGFSVPLRWKGKIIFKLLTQFPPLPTIKKALPILFVPFR